MKPILLEIPSEVVAAANIPPSEIVQTLKKELAVHLYDRQILPKAAARRLAELDRLAFDHLLSQRGIFSRLDLEDIDGDLDILQTPNQ